MSGPGCWLCLWAAASYFCCLWPHGCSGCRVVYLGRAALCARGRRPAREPSAPRVAACCPDRSPAAARPARPLAVRAASFARRVGSKPGQAPQASRRPPIGRGCLCVAWPGPATAHGHRSLALPPPTGTAARPSGPSGTPPAVPVVLVCPARINRPRAPQQGPPVPPAPHR